MAAVPGMVPRKAGFKHPAPTGRVPKVKPDEMDVAAGGRLPGIPGPDRKNPPPPGKSKTNASPGPGATGTGGGRDTPEAGKERGIFEKERQGRGTGIDRPPIYKPKPSLSPAGRSLKGSSAVHGMIARY